MKFFLVLVLSVLSLTASAADHVIGSCFEGNIRVQFSKSGKRFFVSIQNKDRNNQYSDFEDGYYNGREELKTVILTSYANVEIVKDGAFKGALLFTSSKKDPSSRASKAKLWELLVHLNQNYTDVGVFPAQNFQPSKNQLHCDSGLFQKLRSIVTLSTQQ